MDRNKCQIKNEFLSNFIKILKKFVKFLHNIHNNFKLDYLISQLLWQFAK